MENNITPEVIPSETQIKKTASSFDIKNADASKPSIKVQIDLLGKSFSIDNTIDLSKGIKFEVGGCKDIELLKSIIESYNKAIEVIEQEFADAAALEEASAITEPTSPIEP